MTTCGQSWRSLAKSARGAAAARYRNGTLHSRAAPSMSAAMIASKQPWMTVAGADDDRLRQADLATQPSDVVGEARDRVFARRCVALSMTAQIDRHDPVPLAEVLALRREVAMIARPAVHQHQRR